MQRAASNCKRNGIGAIPAAIRFILPEENCWQFIEVVTVRASVSQGRAEAAVSWPLQPAADVAGVCI